MIYETDIKVGIQALEVTEQTVRLNPHMFQLL